ncbi:MAG: sigma 54-dependent Fis family transcriptional regulator [Archangiaceae bacterium]|nr:sigma 54-dependent Fis family transcriptional regulator [Archangiaceae bacterium]
MSDSTQRLTHEESAPLKVKLRVVGGPDFGKELLVERGSYTVGRAPECDLALADSSCSRTHLIVQAMPSGVKLTDNGSANGTKVLGKKFTSLEAGVGTEVTLGKTTLKVELAGTPRSALVPSSQSRFGPLLGQSLRMREVFALLERLARADVDVTFCGETGTGKELAARALHDQSSRAKAPWQVIDFASVSHELLEAELFGYVKGAFTGAGDDRAGPFETARGGTVLLDEIGELPLDLQSRLLRLLERREVRRVGTTDWLAVDIRVLVSTRKNLEAEVKAKRFREDLFHRLAATQVVLPALRDRPDDIPLLIRHFAQGLGRTDSELAPETRALMSSYAWPGNVRELKNLVERVLTLGDSVFQGGPSEKVDDLKFKDAKERLIDAWETEYLRRLMERCDGNLSKAARESGVGRLHLRRLLKKHGLRDDPEDGSDTDEGAP